MEGIDAATGGTSAGTPLARIPGSDIPPDDRERVDNANRQALCALMAEWNLQIRQSEFDNWRPTRPTGGNIPGIERELTCVATDGLLGWFTSVDHPPLLGHVTHFEWTQSVEMSIPYIDPRTGENKMFHKSQKRGCPLPLYSTSKGMKSHAERRAPREKKTKMSLIDKALALLNKTIERK